LTAVRGETWKYVHFTKLPPLFFDLSADPCEFDDLAADPAAAPRVLAAAQKLISWRMNHEDAALDHIALTPSGLLSRPSPRY
jgi:arylsulfatase A-like enzyme